MALEDAVRFSGSRVDPLRGFKFKVNIEGINGAVCFSKVSGLSLGESDVIEYREGCDPITPRQIPGLNKFEPVVFERGMAFNDDLVQWRKEVAAIIGGGALAPDGLNVAGFRREMTVSLIHNTGAIVKVWQIFNAWPRSLKYGDLDANSSDLVIETLEVVNEGIDLITNKVSSSIAFSLGASAGTII